MMVRPYMSAPTQTALRVRPATAADVPLILDFIRGLAEYERAPEEAVATEADLLRDGFGPVPRFRVVIAEWQGKPAGFAFFFFNYSTWKGRPGLFLEDLFVRPEFRGKGIGKALLVHLAKIAVEENCGRFDWNVLDWNTPAIEFYESLGAKLLKEWRVMRVDGEVLKQLAAISDKQ
jgi:GNAT superfamily N-acetyltransferase